jgi:hypothetical protein
LGLVGDRARSNRGNFGPPKSASSSYRTKNLTLVEQISAVTMPRKYHHHHHLQIRSIDRPLVARLEQVQRRVAVNVQVQTSKKKRCKHNNRDVLRTNHPVRRAKKTNMRHMALPSVHSSIHIPLTTTTGRMGVGCRCHDETARGRNLCSLVSISPRVDLRPRPPELSEFR